MIKKSTYGWNSERKVRKRTAKNERIKENGTNTQRMNDKTEARRKEWRKGENLGD